MKDFPIYPLERLLKKAGAKRVSKQAVLELKKILLEYAEKIGKEAIILCRHAKRKTIKKEDIELAVSK